MTSQKPIRSETLTGDDERTYINQLLAIIRAARLNDRYTDPRRLGAHIRAMSSEVHRGEYDGIQVNIDSGLPTYREFTRVQTDVQIAGDQLNKLGSRRELARKAAESDHQVHRRQLAKYDYYDDIADTPLVPLGAMDVTLRRIEPDENRAHFRITFDKLDASGVFTRHSIELSQQKSVWSRNIVELDEETSSHTDEFQSLIYKFSAMDAEFTYAKLETLSGVTVQRVTKGTVGPIYFGRWDAPESIKEIIGDDPDRFVAMFGLDNAADDVDEHKNNDPFGELFEHQLTGNMRATYARAREQFDYRVYRDRKFVVPRGLENDVRALCEERGTKNIVYSVR